MKKTYLTAIISLILAGALTGCRANNSTASGAVAVAYNALQWNSLDLLRQVLAGDALERYGNAEGMAKLKAEYQGYRLLSNRATLIRSRYYRDGRVGLETFTVEVHGKNPSAGSTEERVLTAEVDCSITYELFTIPVGTSQLGTREFRVDRCRTTHLSL